MSYEHEFRELGHCGGNLTVTVVTDTDGQKKYQLGYRHSSINPASSSNVYATLEGQPIAFLKMGVIGERTSLPLAPGISVLLASDTQGMYGHECPRCKEYWRSGGFPAASRMVCPYCGLRAASQNFFTNRQRKYVRGFCKLVVEAIEQPDGEYPIDLDAVADAVFRGRWPHRFIYPCPMLFYWVLACECSNRLQRTA